MSCRKQLWLIFTLFGLYFCLYSPSRAFAQTPASLLWEPEFEVNFSTESPWSYSLGMANRSLFFTYENGERTATSEQEHFELNQFTNYAIGENSSAALGFRYRFREIFDDRRYDEFRVVEEFSYSHPGSTWGLGHRVRTEQRFRNIITIFRFRYQIGIFRPVDEKLGIGFSTETLYSVAKLAKPEAEQRFTLELESTHIQELELSLGIQWKHENYNNQPENNFFLLTGASLQL